MKRVKSSAQEYLRSLWHIQGFEDGMITVDSRDVGGNTPLHIALYQEDEIAARNLIEAGADVNAVGEDGITPLHIAASKGYTELAFTLLENGADPSAMDCFGSTPKDKAVLHGHVALTSLLKNLAEGE